MTRKFLTLFGLAALAFAVSRWGDTPALGDHDDDDFGGSFCAPASQVGYHGACHPVTRNYQHAGQSAYRSYPNSGYGSACQPVHRSSYYGRSSSGYYGGSSGYYGGSSGYYGGSSGYYGGSSGYYGGSSGFNRAFYRFNRGYPGFSRGFSGGFMSRRW